jgi:lipopolysaccharide export LptBFGC system permease protein LptF
MWQRIQTVFLALVVICMAICLFLPIGIFTDTASGDSHQLYPLHYTVVSKEQRTTTYFPYSITAILMTAAATLAALSITKFENRITQIKLGTLNSLVLALVMVSMVVFFNPLAKQFPGGRLGINLWGTFAAVAFNWFSLRLIRKDEKMVRDSERLR